MPRACNEANRATGSISSMSSSMTSRVGVVVNGVDDGGKGVVLFAQQVNRTEQIDAVPIAFGDPDHRGFAVRECRGLG